MKRKALPKARADKIAFDIKERGRYIGRNGRGEYRVTALELLELFGTKRPEIMP